MKKQLRMENFLYHNNKIYFVDADLNLLCCASLDNKKVEIIDSIPEENINENYLASDIQIYKNKLIIIPNVAKKLWIYDMDIRSWHGVDINTYKVEYIKYKFFQAVLWNNKLLLLGHQYPMNVRVDLDTEEIEYLDIPNEVSDGYNFTQNVLFRDGYVIKDNFLYAPTCGSNYVMKLNLNTCDTKWERVGEEDNRFSGIVWHENYFWLSSNNKDEIVKWDGKKSANVIKGTLNIKNTWNYMGIVQHNGYLIVPALLGKQTMYLDLNGDINYINACFNCFKKIENENLILAQNRNGEMIIINEDLKMYKFFFSLDMEQFKERIRLKKDDVLKSFGNAICSENSFFNLNMFLELLLS